MKQAFVIGKNLYLRPLSIEDASDRYIDWINDENIIENLETLYFPISIDQLTQYIKNIHQDPNTAFFAIIEKASNKYIGNVKLGPIDWIKRKAAYGRMIGDTDTRGKGYGTEVTRLILKYGFERLNLHKISAGALITNIGSIKSNEQAGMKIEATFKGEIPRNGKWIDTVILSMTSDEYFAGKNSA